MDGPPAPPPPPPPPFDGPPPPPHAHIPVSKGGASLSELLAKRVKKTGGDSEEGNEPVWSVASAQYLTQKSKTGFVGLSNQGATCYLNSLIQTLYMTPELRHTLYQWQYDPTFDGPEEFCIPLQLQRLFLRLQLGSAAIVETKDLTTSFRWTGSQAFQQHDVQELLRKLFEALDVCLTRGATAIRSKKKDASTAPSSAGASTELPAEATEAKSSEKSSVEDAKSAQEPFNYGNITANLVNDLYEGTILDYIRCMECNYARERRDPFFDVPVAIREVESIEAGLEKYLTPEILSEGNQWRCDQCGVPVDAFKGLQFAKLPYFLTLQLNRFDYDYQTWRRIKLNNKVTFPLTLDMNPFYTDESASPAQQAPAGDTQPLKNQYELYSVMIHSGGAEGGHYYAFVKSIENDKWFKFNDASVNEISYEDICTVFGGAPPKNQEKPTVATGSTQSGEEKSAPAPQVSAVKQALHSSYSTNAYMLLYRLVDPTRNMKSVKAESIPESNLAWIQAENIEFDRLRAEHQKRLDNVALSVYYDHSLLPDGGEEEEAKKKSVSTANPHPTATDHMSILTVNVDKHETLEKAMEMVYEAGVMRGLKLASLQCCRLRPFAPQTGTKAPSWLASSAQSTLEQLNFHHQKNVYLEVKPASEINWVDEEVFYTLGIIKYIPGKPLAEPNTSSAVIHAKAGHFEPAVSLRVPWRATLATLKQLISFNTSLGPVPPTLSELKEIYANVEPEKDEKLTAQLSPLASSDGLYLRIFVVDSVANCRELKGDDGVLNEVHQLNDGQCLHIEYTPALDRPASSLANQSSESSSSSSSAPSSNSAEGSEIKVLPASLVAAKFDEERHKVQIFYNKFDSSNFENSLLIDTRLTLKQLKAEIAEALGVSPQEFKLCRNLLSKEFNNLDLTLSAANLYEGSAVCLVRGRPIGVNQIKLKISILKGSIDDEESFSTPWTVTVEEGCLVDELRLVVSSSPELDEYLVSIGKFENIESAANATKHIRLREKKANRCASVLFDGETLKDAMDNLMDGDEVIVQILEEADQLLKNQLILTFRRWIPSLRQLEPSSFELIVPRSATMATAKVLLAEHLVMRASLAEAEEALKGDHKQEDGHNKETKEETKSGEEGEASGSAAISSASKPISKTIPVQFLGVSKPYLFMIKKKDANALSGLNWELAEDVQLTQSPWYLGDGSLLLFKDMTDPEHGPIEASSVSSSGSGGSQPRREQQLKIHTIYDDDEEDLQENPDLAKVDPAAPPAPPAPSTTSAVDK